ncbi:hypothetical protein BS17DRAFT_804538 [Gyrodon lividus]|nr:hypothetical protein BS17DRAFT_804538 [Gyrodon lividus]
MYSFSKASSEELEVLYQWCQPATFGLNVFDETYRKAGKMDLDAFLTLFDPRRLGIHDVIDSELLASVTRAYQDRVASSSSRDTPHDYKMFGSLVVIFPSPHEGSQLGLRLGDKKWTVDFADKFAAAAEPSICFVTFFSDVEHGPPRLVRLSSHSRLQPLLHDTERHRPHHFWSGLLEAERSVDLVNDEETLPNYGYLGFGRRHQYVYDESNNSLLDKLKGWDSALANVCKETFVEASLCRS